ncbi:MAG TPA: ABC transporter substrate-binding protein [Acidimicrobiales bacterium]
MALSISLALVAAACADDDDSTSAGDGGGDNGDAVTIFGPEVEQEQQSLQEAFDGFTDDTGIKVDVSGSRDFETEVGAQVDGGNPPDIAMYPQPGKVGDFAEDLVSLPDDVVTEAEANFDPGWTDLVTVEGDLKAIPAKADLKSLVWYSPSAFEAAGYTVPETFEDFLALTDRMMADGKTPFCVGLESGDATGWPATDWIEDFMLRLKGPDVYDQWYKHEIPFDDPDVVEAAQAVFDLWSKPNFVFGGEQNVAATPFADAGLPLLDGDCMMHRQGNFYKANWPMDTEVGPDGDVNAFYLPGSTENPNITLSGGIYAAAFNDSDDVMQVMKFIASPDFANARASNEIGGFLSPNKNVDTTKYTTEAEQGFGAILADADPVRFDASDLMPGEVGSGTFWTAVVDVTTGAKDVKTAFSEVESSWPSD